MSSLETILITGGAGFIGGAVCRHLVSTGRYRVINLDKLTYSGSLSSVNHLEGSGHYKFYQADICDQNDVKTIFELERPTKIMHLAAESHVDRSIDGPAPFIETNIVGTFRLLEVSLSYYRSLPKPEQEEFVFHHISTDEVFGDLPFDGSVFTEDTPYAPSSPYSASKAASDHLVRAWHHTYGLPAVLSNCSNNYGPYQFPEKLVPLVILNALEEKPLPVYGKGENVRDWLFVDDHARALECVLSRGRIGESYNVGGRAERTNLSVVQQICAELDQRRPRSDGSSYAGLINFVTDRPGHDRRYAINPGKIETELGWRPLESFESGLAKTVDWYLGHSSWWQLIRAQSYAGERLGQAT
jgi:dTDP-glucose 4,6-dehydratase